MCSIRTYLNFGFIVAVICALAPLSSAQNVNCSSEDGRRHYCPVDTRGGVQMVKQRSDAACTQGRTWGYDRGGIWVDRGCRADFFVGQGGYGDRGYGGGSNGGGSQLVNCSSEDGGRHVCPIDSNGRVRLQRQRSGSACIEGSTWGYGNGQIWVDRGCRADFTVEARDGDDWHRGRDWDRDRDRDRDRDWDRDRDRDRRGGSEADQFVNCSSEDGHRKYCPIDTRHGRVQMVKQRSDSACIQGRTWGYDRGGIWVDRGCRADFQVVR